jgi:hypothetical protein
VFDGDDGGTEEGISEALQQMLEDCAWQRRPSSWSSGGSTMAVRGK